MHVDVLVLGAGPAGHKAAIQAAKAGRQVLLVDRDPSAGGECVQRGTIPSKTLRESASYLIGLRARSEGVIDISVPAQTQVASLMRRLKAVRASHERFLDGQLERNGVQRLRGRACFVSPAAVEVRSPDRSVRRVHADVIVIATGSRPRQPAHVPVDHEHVLDSDSILSLIYLPESLTILGAGVIACEFASIFAALGVKVTLVDAGVRPLAFLDPELTAQYLASFERMGGRFLAKQKTSSVHWDGRAVVTECEGGEVLRSEKLLCALGRVANVQDLDLGAAGLALTPRGHIPVDANLRTCVPHIYAAGDVLGPPALAATAMDQGRRAVRHALGLPLDNAGECIPVGIYTIPEIASVGLTEEQAREKYGSAFVGRAKFDELARAHINGTTDGLLKLVADPHGKVVGAHIVGEAA
ncbi:MAG: FAD-dependent oxidoreductase, partial [Planctomycetes bacterium]|nr:FAD-dependent oxidoreductase [Planctomycetota bacterium]